MSDGKILTSQRDFSAGELDVEVRRHDDMPLLRAGGRQMANWRILNSGTLAQRPGRSALFLHRGRVDEVSVPIGITGIYTDGAWQVIRNGSNYAISNATLGVNIAVTFNSPIVRLADVRARYLAGAAVTGAFYGDSITFGYNGVDTNANPFPQTFGQSVNALAGSMGLTVINRGFPGDTVANGIARWVGASNTDFAVFTYGTNDANGFTGPIVPLGTYLLGLFAFIQPKIDAGTAVLLQPPPIGRTPYDTPVAPYRDAVRVLASALGIDFHDPQADLAGLANPWAADGVHYTNASDIVWGQNLAGWFMGGARSSAAAGISDNPSPNWRLCFGADGSFQIRDANGTIAASMSIGTYPWTESTVDQIVWTKVSVNGNQSAVVITFPGMQPAVATFDGVSTWTIAPLTFTTGADNAPLVPYYRVTAQGATMTPSATAGAGDTITVEFSAPVLLPGHVGTLFRFAGRRMRITAVTDAQHASAVAIDAFLPTQELVVAAPSGTSGGTGANGFSLGQVVEGSTTSCQGEVVGIDLGSNTITVQVTNFATGFQAAELVVGPAGRSTASSVSTVAPLGAVSWDEQIVSAARGWPRSCSNDRGRLILCDMPSLPEGILWSAVGLPFDFDVQAAGSAAMVEIIAGKPRVYHVGAWYDEIVFTDKGIFYIPIGISTPLIPGSVQFLPIAPEASSSVKPAFTSEGFLYVNAGRNRVVGIVGSGAAYSTRPYLLKDASQYHGHLFAAEPKALAITTGDDVPERYIYVVNRDGSVVTGRYEPSKDWIGWAPWTCAGTVNWVSALAADVLFTTVYGPTSLAEGQDAGQYLDVAVPVNAVPTVLAFTGMGPLWWMRGQGTVTLMDGRKVLGPHTIDQNGNIVPAYPGEDLTSATLVAGQPFTPVFEPFVPNAEPGQDAKQRTRRRRVPRMAATVSNSTGFLFATLYAGPLGAHLPEPGAVIASRRVSAWNQGDDQSQAPPLRSGTERYRSLGRSFDPRNAIIKDTPGPLEIIEIGMEATV